MKISKLWVGLSIITTCATYSSVQNASGSSYFLGFSIISLLLLHTIKIGSFSWFYTFFSIFFFLGCWLKVAIHHIFDYPYIEASGNFSGTRTEWISYYTYASIFAIGIMVGKFIWHLVPKRKNRRDNPWVHAQPVHYTSWIILIFFAVIFYAINTYFAFFVTGTKPNIFLPFGLNAPIAFIASTGAPLVFSLFFARDVITSNRIGPQSLIATLLLIGLASTSMASRSFIVIYSIPMIVAAIYVVSRRGTTDYSKMPFVYFGFFLVLVLALVSIFRIVLFLDGSLSDTTLIVKFALQSAFLAVDRWIGAEPIMTAVSESSTSLDLMIRILLESPATGVDSIYQNLAGSRYEFLDKFTFLTLPGFFGIVSLSGSLIIALIATASVTLAGIFYEQFIRFSLFNQPISVALASTAVANSITQMSFPYLLLPFLFQLTLFLLIVRYSLTLQIRPSRMSKYFQTT